MSRTRGDGGRAEKEHVVGKNHPLVVQELVEEGIQLVPDHAATCFCTAVAFVAGGEIQVPQVDPVGFP